MSGSEMLSWAFSQLEKVIEYCFNWAVELIDSVGGIPLLTYLFFIGVVGALVIAPVVGDGIAGIKADSVYYWKKGTGQIKDDD